MSNNEPRDTLPPSGAATTIPAPPPFVVLFESVAQNMPRSRPRSQPSAWFYTDVAASNEDWDGFAGEELDDD